MPVEPYDTVVIDGHEYWDINIRARVLKDGDPDSHVWIFVATPTGGAANLGPLVKGDPGKHTVIDDAIDFTALTHDDPTPASAEFTVTTPGSDTVSQVVKLALALHEGEPGADGTTSLDLETVGGDIAVGKTIVVNEDSDGFDFATIKVGDRYFPAAVNSTPSGNSGYTLCQVSIGPLDFDWRPEVHGECVVTGTGTDVAVDLIARLNSATAGNVVGRGLGIAGQNPPTHILGPGVTAADVSAGGADYDLVSAGDTAVIYLRAERQTGSDTFTTSDSRTTYWVKANAVP